MESVNKVVVRGQIVFVVLTLNADERALLMANGKSLFRAFSPPGNVALVRQYFRALDQAVRKRQLPRSGPFSPYIRYAFDLAEARAGTGSAQEEVSAAMMALAIYCGHWRVQYLVGEVTTGDLKGRRFLCSNVTLAGRQDLRQHFIVSAALEIASKRGTAFPIGEVKELLDSNRHGTGFSFDDLAADRAGIRFASRMLAAASDATQRRMLVDRLDSGAAVMPSIAGLPPAMSDAEFKRRYGTVDSAKYKAVLDVIDERIDNLPFYSAP